MYRLTAYADRVYAWAVRRTFTPEEAADKGHLLRRTGAIQVIFPAILNKS